MVGEASLGKQACNTDIQSEIRNMFVRINIRALRCSLQVHIVLFRAYRRLHTLEHI